MGNPDRRGSYPIIAQRFIPAIKQGDKRIIIINGTPFPYMLVRLPKDGSIRGNLAVSGDHEVRKLDKKIWKSPQLSENAYSRKVFCWPELILSALI